MARTPRREKKRLRPSAVAILAAGAYAMLVLFFAVNAAVNRFSFTQPGRYEAQGGAVLSERTAGETAPTAELPEQGQWFYYDRLDQPGRVLYAEIYKALSEREDQVLLSQTDEAQIERAFNCVMDDHPELFYVSGYATTRYGGQTAGARCGFSGRYCYESDEAARLAEQIEDYTRTCFAGLSEHADEYETAKYIYEYLIDHTIYTDPSPDDQNICSVMIAGKSICMGYARATQYLLQRAGLQAALVTGTADTGARTGVSHAWDLVRLDGAWYYIDTTWGDTAYASGAFLLGGDTINYDYLLVTSEDIAPTHRDSGLVRLPECKAIRDNYYVREGAYFYEPDFDDFAALTRMRIDAGARNVSCKCADEACFEALGRILFEDGRIFECVDKAPGEQLSYLMTPEQHTITVWFN